MYIDDFSEQYKTFLTPENFKLAFKRLQTAQRNLYKELYFEDLRVFGFYLDQNIDSLINEIQQGIFNPEKSYKIFIPKKDRRVRPLSLLKFKDLLVYQALVNAIVGTAYDEIAPYYNTFLFGNVVVSPQAPSNRKIFFYRQWKEQWRRFGDKTKEYYDDGYRFLSEFDIASFFDTIDHSILCQILSNTYKVEKDILDLLSLCLESWTGDSNHKTFKSKHGIPQGPIGSAFLADVYLLHLDLELRKSSELDIKYIRYVDDIRIFSRDEVTAQKAIALLDLLARDLGLIPQGSKIFINEIDDDIDTLLRHQKSKFSAITREYEQKDRTLKARTHRKLKKRFLDCFDPNSAEKELDKTIIGFSLYKLNKDDEIKDKIIAEYEKLYTHFPAILFYLKQHFSDDAKVREWLFGIITDEDLLFHHVIALVLKEFPDLPFIESVYNRYICERNRHWLINFFIINWLYQNNKEDIIISDLMLSHQPDNYFVKRELNRIRFEISDEPIYKDLFATSLLKNKDSLTSLQGVYIHPSIVSKGISDCSSMNNYVQYIFSNYRIDYIVHTLKEKFSIQTPENFFNKNIWDEPEVYKGLNESFSLFYNFKDVNLSSSLISLNTFNNLVFDKICQRLSLPIKSEKYGTNLDSGCIASKFPITSFCFAEVNKRRNQSTEAHPYGKDGNFRVKIKFSEFNILLKREISSLEEVCKFTF